MTEQAPEPYPPPVNPWSPPPPTFVISADTWNPTSEGGTVYTQTFELTTPPGGLDDAARAGAELVARFLFDEFDWSTIGWGQLASRPIRVRVERSQTGREMVLDLGPRPEQQEEP
jgi:hypothetical protein